MEIFIRDFAGIEHSAIVMPHTKVGLLLEQLEFEEGIELKGKVFLSFEGDQIKADILLVQLGICEGCVLEMQQDEQYIATQVLKTYKKNSYKRLISECKDMKFVTALVISGHFKKKYKYFVYSLLKVGLYDLAKTALSKIDANDNFCCFSLQVKNLATKVGSGNLAKYALKLNSSQALEVVLSSNYDINRIVDSRLDLFAIQYCSLSIIKIIDKTCPILLSSHNFFLSRLQSAFSSKPEERSEIVVYVVESYNFKPGDYFISDSIINDCIKNGNPPTLILDVISSKFKNNICKHMLSSTHLSDEQHAALLISGFVKKQSLKSIKTSLKRHCRAGNFTAVKAILQSETYLRSDVKIALECIIEFSQFAKFTCGRSLKKHLENPCHSGCIKTVGDPEGLTNAFYPLFHNGGGRISGADIDQHVQQTGADHPLIIASRFGNLKLLKWMLDDLSPPVNINVSTSANTTALSVACTLGDPDVITFLLQRRAAYTHSVYMSELRSGWFQVSDLIYYSNLNNTFCNSYTDVSTCYG